MRKSRASLEPFWDLKINEICRVSYASGVHYKECATHTVVVQTSLSRFDVTEYY